MPDSLSEPEPEPELPEFPGQPALSSSSSSHRLSARSRSPRDRDRHVEASVGEPARVPVEGQTHVWPRFKPGPRCKCRCARPSLRNSSSIVGLKGRRCATASSVSKVTSDDCCCICQGKEEHPDYQSGPGGRRTPKCFYHADHPVNIKHTCEQCLHLAWHYTPQDVCDSL